MTQRQRGMVFASLAIASWGGYFVFGKMVLTHISPLTFGWIRFGIGAAVLVVLSLWYKVRFQLQSKRDGWLILASGLIGITIHQSAQITGLVYTSATNAAWLLAITPIATGLFGWLLLKEKLRWQQLTGAMIATVAVIVLISNGRLASLSLINNFGDVLIASGIITWSLYTILSRALVRRYASLSLSAYQMIIGFISFSFIGNNSILTELPQLTTRDWFIMVAIGTFTSGLAYYWWNRGLSLLGSMNTSIFLYLESIMTTVLAMIILREALTLVRALSIVIIIFGVHLALRQPPPRHST